MGATDTERIRICHVANVASSVRYLLLNQLLALQDAGYDVTAVSADGPDARCVEEVGIRHIPVEMTRRITPFRDLKTLHDLWALFRRKRFTIVHTHNPKPGLLGRLFGKS